MKHFIRNNKIRTFIYITLVAVFLAGAIGITSVAANSAIPGDSLYKLKTSLEQTQFRLSQDAGDRAQLKIEFAEKRLAEIGELVSQGRYTEINDTVLAFESAINGALIELETVVKSDPSRASSLNIEISEALSKYAQVLTTLATTVPETIQLEVMRALESTLLADSLDLYDDDDMNSNGNDDDDDDDMNSNGNDDVDDDNMNSNGNDDDDDDDMNSNGNDDDDDDDMNSNGNDDDDDDDMNSNGNDDDDDDDSNSNSNSDDDDDDDSNSNSNSNDDDDDDDDNDNNLNGDDDDDNDDNLNTNGDDDEADDDD